MGDLIQTYSPADSLKSQTVKGSLDIQILIVNLVQNKYFGCNNLDYSSNDLCITCVCLLITPAVDYHTAKS